MNQKEVNRIAYLIDFIKNKHVSSPKDDLPYYEELLALSKKNAHLYGQAFAQIRLAQANLIMQNYPLYMEHILIAKEIAENNNYFDILLYYYNNEGIRFMKNFDEISALTMFLKGVNVASEISDYDFCAIFYNNAAEIFYDNKDYKTALKYYLKSLAVLETKKSTMGEEYHKAILENVIRVYCLMKDVKRASKYFEKYNSISIENPMFPFTQSDAEIRILLLKKEKELALQKLLKLFDEMQNSNVDENLLVYLYLFLCETFLSFQRREETEKCLQLLSNMNLEINQNTLIEIAKLKVQFCETFGVKDPTIYQSFYELTKRSEQSNLDMITKSLHSSISFYEMEKENEQVKKEKRNLMELAMFDELTGVYNRRHYQRMIEKQYKKKKISSITHIMIDVDYFKEYNDYYGHQKGDVILKQVAKCIQESLLKEGLLARYGGDEFACFILNQPLDKVYAFLEQVQKTILEADIAHVKAKGVKRLTLSMGACYITNKKNLTFQELVRCSDEVLYEVKKQGRNQFLLKEVDL